MDSSGLSSALHNSLAGVVAAGGATTAAVPAAQQLLSPGDENYTAISFPTSGHDRTTSGTRSIGTREVADPVEDFDEEGEREEGFSCQKFLHILGPGIMVCLADTDGPCLVTAAASGSLYGYSLVAIQIVLIPILFAAQELTARLSLVTGKGLTELIRIHFGLWPARLACLVLVITCVAGIISEIACVAQIGTLFGIPMWVSGLFVVVLLVVIVFNASTFRTVEMIGVAMGSLQVLLFGIMFAVRPDWTEVLHGLAETRFHDPTWVKLFAANIGAVIMPWMLFYQQSASCERKLRPKDLLYSRLDTIIGATVAQGVMISMVITMGATLFKIRPRELQEMHEIVDAIVPALGSRFWANVIVGVSATGSSLVAALVVSITPAWSICELLAMERSYGRPYQEAKGFYNSFLLCLVGAFVITVCPEVGDRAWLMIQVEVLNALLMPVVVGFIFFLASKRGVLSEKHRLRNGWYRWLLGTVFGLCSLLCVYAGLFVGGG